MNDDMLFDFDVANGVIVNEIGVPVSSAVVGTIVHQQVLPVEIGAGGNIVALTVGSTIRTTIGSF